MNETLPCTDEMMDTIQNADDSSLITLIEISETESEDENQNANNEHKRLNQVNLKNMKRSIRNWRKCLACGVRENLHRPSKRMRRFFCKSKKIYIQENDRVCDYHLQSQNWDQIDFRTASHFSGKIVDEMISLLLKSPRESESLDTAVDIGLTDTQFKQVIREMGFPENPDRIQKRLIISVKIYLERLRQGHTYEQMAQRHNMSRRAISQKVECGRNLLLRNFVPNHLGFGNRTREWLESHTTDLARLLYCGNDPKKCVFICDGTYVYTCSTSNYAQQRKLYSGQKHRHLFKIMKIVSVDGSIIDVVGPFSANQNDATILRIVFEKTAIEQIFNAGDVILVDRGFRDCVNFLKSKNLDVKIPEFVQKGQKRQLTTNQANKSRMVTKMRYAIEVANGRMKNKWHIFCKIIPSILTKHLMPDYKIGAALLNAFAKPIICDKDDYLNVGTRMLNQVDFKNKLQKTIRSRAFKRTQRLFVQRIDPAQLNFPRFNQTQLKNFALGNYAIRQAISYTADHVKLHGEFEIFTLPTKHIRAHFGSICATENFENPMFITTKIKSRFKGQRIHNVYILYDFTPVVEKQLFYLCECQHGQRTVGCCAHVMALVWYFGYGRHEMSIDPGSHLNDFFDQLI